MCEKSVACACTEIKEKANNSIETLVDGIIALRKEKNYMYCCYPGVFRNNACDGECISCKEMYYTKMKENMMNTYRV